MDHTRMTLRAHNVGSLERRVALIRDLIRGTGSIGAAGTIRDPLMRQLGLAVTQACKARNDECELRAVYDFIVNNVRYTGDVAGRDTYQTALRTLQFAGGDCDDHSILACVLAMENGFFCKVRITSNTGASWDHIYAMAGVPKHNPVRYIPLDTTLGAGKFGREPRRAKFQDFSMGSPEDD